MLQKKKKVDSVTNLAVTLRLSLFYIVDMLQTSVYARLYEQLVSFCS